MPPNIINFLFNFLFIIIFSIAYIIAIFKKKSRIKIKEFRNGKNLKLRG